jgi:hypothetical protein
METGVARRPVDLAAYEQRLQLVVGDLANL